MLPYASHPVRDLAPAGRSASRALRDFTSHSALSALAPPSVNEKLLINCMGKIEF